MQKSIQYCEKKMQKSIQAKIDELIAEVHSVAELCNTLIDQAAELNLLLANERKNTYEQVLLKYDRDIVLEALLGKDQSK